MTLLRPAALAALMLTALPATAQNQPGHVLDHVFITEGAGGFSGQLDDNDGFGDAVCVIGDLDGDGVDDLAVGAPGTDDVASNTGGVWILFMKADGTVDAAARIGNTTSQLPFVLEQGDYFGSAVAPAGDLNGDGTPDLWVGARGDDDDQANDPFGGPGCVYGLYLTASGKVDDFVKLAPSTTGLPLDPDGGFGFAVADIGDHNDDGVRDLLVGAPFQDGGGSARGEAWLLLLKPLGLFGDALRLADDGPAPAPTLADNAYFGLSAAGLGDTDGNGSPDFVVGAPQDDVTGNMDGSVWLYRSAPGGGILSVDRLAGDLPAFGGQGPGNQHRFGRSVTALGDIDGDGDMDLAVGANTGGSGSHGAIWILRRSFFGVEAVTLLDDDDGFVPFPLTPFDNLGSSVFPAGDVDGDGRPDLWTGLQGHDQGGNSAGALALLNLRGPTFQNLGNQLAGNSFPVIGGLGTLVDGEDFKVTLTGGPSSGLAQLVIGFNILNVPFRGGVMVPDVDLLVVNLPLDSLGDLTVPGVWPAGVPLGFPTYVQFWMADPGAPQGWAASNAMALIAGA